MLLRNCVFIYIGVSLLLLVTTHIILCCIFQVFFLFLFIRWEMLAAPPHIYTMMRLWLFSDFSIPPTTNSHTFCHIIISHSAPQLHLHMNTFGCYFEFRWKVFFVSHFNGLLFVDDPLITLFAAVKRKKVLCCLRMLRCTSRIAYRCNRIQTSRISIHIPSGRRFMFSSSSTFFSHLILLLLLLLFSKLETQKSSQFSSSFSHRRIPCCSFAKMKWMWISSENLFSLFSFRFCDHRTSLLLYFFFEWIELNRKKARIERKKSRQANHFLFSIFQSPPRRPSCGN
jgi:hypothetical protein